MFTDRRSFLRLSSGFAGAALFADHSAAEVPASALPASPLTDTLRKHLDSLMDGDEAGKMGGKDAEALHAMAFYRMGKITGEAKYNKVAIQLASRTISRMRSSPIGLLDIKEWGPKKIMYGAPPPLGWYGAYTAAILGSQGRAGDVRFIAEVLDRYPWYEGGWWASSADVRTGESLEPLSSASPINKNFAMLMACSVACEQLASADAALAARLRQKVMKCLKTMLPGQHPDGYWTYKLNVPEAQGKDTVGYLMLGTGFLVRTRTMAPTFRSPALDKAIAGAEAFAMKEIAPMTAPNIGKKVARPIGGKTPEHYDPAEIPKRSFQLAVLLADGKYQAEAAKILSHALTVFPHGDRGQKGAQCAEAASLVAVL